MLGFSSSPPCHLTKFCRQKVSREVMRSLISFGSKNYMEALIFSEFAEIRQTRYWVPHVPHAKENGGVGTFTSRMLWIKGIVD